MSYFCQFIFVDPLDLVVEQKPNKSQGNRTNLNKTSQTKTGLNRICWDRLISKTK